MSDVCHVVTGAAGGIGLAVVERLMERQELVVAVDVNAESLAARFDGRTNVLPVACDLTSDEGVRKLVDAIGARNVQVQSFVHAAGFDQMAPLGMIKSDDVQRLMAIHAVFPMQFLGWMSKKTNHAAEAAAVLISSLSAHEGAKGHVAYAAAKGAVEGLLRPAAAELVGKGIRLNAVVLGVVETEMSKGWIGKLMPDQIDALHRDYPLGLGRPENVAEVIGFLLSPAARWVTGQTLVCDGGHGVV